MDPKPLKLYFDYKSPFAYLEREGRAELDAIQQRADADEIFGVPIFIIEGEMFWGHDRIPLVKEKLEAMGLKK